ncbi:hypothetical protein MASR2M29_22390 [Spirochaetota bacterium]
MHSIFASTGFSLRGSELLSGLVIYFYLFGFIGWLVEMLYLSTAKRGLINSGFLLGPICPAYAVGALFIYPFSVLFSPMPFWIQGILYAVLATLIEYSAHITLEKVLGIRIWDYSDEFMNYQGRISLKYTLFWFVLVILFVLFLQPAAIFIIEKMTVNFRKLLSITFALALLLDYALSFYLYIKMKAVIGKICTVFKLPKKEMQELQFNRPRIMNEKKRIEKLLSEKSYAELLAEVELALFGEGQKWYFEFDPYAYADIISSKKYDAWRNRDQKSRSVYNHYLRIAELSHTFCKTLGLDAESAARGVLLSAYQSTSNLKAVKLVDFLFQQWRIVFAIYKDLGVMNRKELDIVLRYKWPLNFGPPRTKEGLLVSFAEKLVQSKEFRMEIKTLYSMEIGVAKHAGPIPQRP